MPKSNPLQMQECRIGLVAVRKKPRYALPQARVTGCHMEAVERQHVVEAGVPFTLNGTRLRHESELSLEALGY